MDSDEKMEKLPHSLINSFNPINNLILWHSDRCSRNIDESHGVVSEEDGSFDEGNTLGLLVGFCRISYNFVRTQPFL